MGGPLAGIKVIEIGQAVAGPLAGAILADMGADVIKLERPDGGDDARSWGTQMPDGSGLSFHAYNRNKRSAIVDIKNPADVARIKELAGDADILIQNLRAGVIQEAGLGPDVLMAINPRLIYCSVWAFGPKGPLSNAPGFDPLLQAYGGVMTLTGRPTDPPTFCAPAINDKSTAQWCVIGALGALQQRERTGKGCVIDTSLFDSAVAWVEGSVNTYWHNRTMSTRSGTASDNLVPYQTFNTSDRPICIAAGNDRIFARMAQAMGAGEWSKDERFARNPGRRANKTELIALMEPILQTRKRAEWLATFAEVGVPAGPVNNIAELTETEQITASDLMRVLPRSNLRVVGLPIAFDGERPHPRADAPKLGEHTSEIFGLA